MLVETSTFCDLMYFTILLAELSLPMVSAINTTRLRMKGMLRMVCRSMMSFSIMVLNTPERYSLTMPSLSIPMSLSAGSPPKLRYFQSASSLSVRLWNSRNSV